MANASELRKRTVDLMVNRAGKNSYTQGGNRIYFFGKPDNRPGNTSQPGFSDCSSAVREAIKAATGIDIGANTSAQINNRTIKGMVVHTTTGYFPDETVLLPGDCLYFKGNTSHPLDVGHVEMYIGDGKICGHGSGTGPKIKKMKDYCQSRATAKRRYFMTIRWILDDADDTGDAIMILRKGMYDNPYVLKLQKDLKLLGYALDADGDFGSETERIVKTFQTANKIAASGIVDAATHAAIAEALEGLSDNDETEMPPVVAVNGVDIAAGSWNVRSGPGTEYAIAGTVNGGDRLEKIDLDGWTPVMFNGQVRFIGPKAVQK